MKDLKRKPLSKAFTAAAAICLSVLPAVPAMASTTLAGMNGNVGLLLLIIAIVIAVVIVILVVLLVRNNKKEAREQEEEAQRLIREDYPGVSNGAYDPYAPPGSQENRDTQQNMDPNRISQPYRGSQPYREPQPSGPQPYREPQPSGPQRYRDPQLSEPQLNRDLQPDWSDRPDDEPDGSGETTLLAEGAGATALLQNAVPEACLIRKKNGERIAITEPVFTIGKERRKVDYCISDNPTISRQHIVITRGDTGYFAEDLHSTNMSYIDDVKIIPEKQVELPDGAVLMLSDEEFEFHIENPEEKDR